MSQGIPPDGRLRADGAYRDGTGQLMTYVHDEGKCFDQEACVIHNPSDHSMRSFPTHFRFDRCIMERICPHGVGHPDPDCLYAQRDGGVHGCDGCCAP